MTCVVCGSTKFVLFPIEVEGGAVAYDLTCPHGHAQPNRGAIWVEGSALEVPGEEEETS